MESNMSKKRKNNQNAMCEYCENLIPIGEGDHICLECGSEPKMVICEYCPTDEYMACGGKYFSR